MTRNKYLEDLGIPQDEYGTTFTGDDDERAFKWEEERKEYGFDARETWNMDRLFAEWLYSHLCMYEEVNNIDTTFHKFIVDGKEYTQQECMDIVKDACKDYILTDKWDDDNLKAIEKMERAMMFWGKVLPCMWW